MKDETKRRAELADFLRTRRARLHPEQLGLSTPDMVVTTQCARGM